MIPRPRVPHVILFGLWLLALGYTCYHSGCVKPRLDWIGR